MPDAGFSNCSSSHTENIQHAKSHIFPLWYISVLTEGDESEWSRSRGFKVGGRSEVILQEAENECLVMFVGLGAADAVPFVGVHL